MDDADLLLPALRPQLSAFWNINWKLRRAFNKGYIPPSHLPHQKNVIKIPLYSAQSPWPYILYQGAGPAKRLSWRGVLLHLIRLLLGSVLNK